MRPDLGHNRAHARVPDHQGGRRAAPDQGAQGLRAGRRARDPGQPGHRQAPVPARDGRGLGLAAGGVRRRHRGPACAPAGARGQPRSAAGVGAARIRQRARRVLRRQPRRPRPARLGQGDRRRPARLRARGRGLEPRPPRARHGGDAGRAGRMGLARAGPRGAARQPQGDRTARRPRGLHADPPAGAVPAAICCSTT